MQVERWLLGSDIQQPEWRKGAQHVGNLPRRLGQLREIGANTGWGCRETSFGNQSWGPQGLALRDKPAAYQLVGGVTAHQG